MPPQCASMTIRVIRTISALLQGGGSKGMVWRQFVTVYPSVDRVCGQHPDCKAVDMCNDIFIFWLPD